MILYFICSSFLSFRFLRRLNFLPVLLTVYRKSIMKKTNEELKTVLVRFMFKPIWNSFQQKNISAPQIPSLVKLCPYLSVSDLLHLRSPNSEKGLNHHGKVTRIKGQKFRKFITKQPQISRHFEQVWGSMKAIIYCVKHAMRISKGKIQSRWESVDDNLQAVRIMNNDNALIVVKKRFS